MIHKKPRSFPPPSSSSLPLHFQIHFPPSFPSHIPLTNSTNYLTPLITYHPTHIPTYPPLFPHNISPPQHIPLTTYPPHNISPSQTAGTSLLEERLVPRQKLPPLLISLADRPPEALHYLGVSYGLTGQLLNFWRKCLFLPVYVRQTASDVTGMVFYCCCLCCCCCL